MQIETIKQHYVPQFYLRNFENEKSSFYVFNRSKRKLFESRAKDICYEKYLYETSWEEVNSQLEKYILPNKLEKEFSILENEYNILLKKIITICLEKNSNNLNICNEEEKWELSKFVAMMLLRNKWTLSQIDFNNIPDEIMENNEIQLIDQLLQGMNFGGIKSLIKYSNRQIWLNSELNQGENIPTFLVNDLQKMYMSFFVTQNSYFITSSFPVIFEFYDIKNKSHLKNLFIPLSPKVALQYGKTESMKFKHNQRVFIPEEYVFKMNYFFIKGDMQQYLYIISYDENVLKKIVNRIVYKL